MTSTITTPPIELHEWSSTVASTTHETTPATVSAPAGSVCTLAIAGSSGAITLTVTDSAGNTWERVAQGGTTLAGSTNTAALFLSTLAAPIVAGSTSWTVTRSNSGSIALAVDCWPGAETIDYADAQGGTALGTTASTLDGFAAMPGDVVIGVVSSNPVGTVFTPAAGTEGGKVHELVGTRRLTVYYDDPTGARDVDRTADVQGTFPTAVGWAVAGGALRPLRVPTVSAGADQSVESGDVVDLTGAAAADPENGTHLTGITWAQVAGPPITTLTSSTTLSPSFVAPETVAPVDVVYRLTATASDGRSASDDVTITVGPSTVVPAYTVDLVLGPYTFSIAQGGGMDEGTDPVLVLDGLTLGWRYATEGWPAALEPLQATVGLATSQVAVLADLDLGDVASIRCTDSEGTVFAAVYGNVNELTAEQRLRGTGVDTAVWTFVTAKIVDASVANDTPITMTAAATTQANRVRDIAALAPYPIRTPPEGTTPAPVFKGAAIEEAGVVELLRGYTAKGELIAPARGGWLGAATIVPPKAFLMLAPISDPSGVFRMLSLHAAYFDTEPADLPARLAVVDGLLSLIPAIGSPNAIPGDRVRLEGQWRKGPENSGDAVTLRDGTIAATTYRDGMTTAQRRTAIRADRSVDDYTATRTQLAQLGPLYLDEPQAHGWDREGFVYSPADPIDLSDAWFPNWSTERFAVDVREPDPTRIPSTRPGTPAEPAAPCFTRPVAVFGIPDGHNLAAVSGNYGGSGGSGVYAGHLTAVDLSIAAGRVTVQFALRRQVHRPDAPDETAGSTAALSYAELRTIAPAVSYRGPGARVDPGLTLSDLRLARD